MQRKSLMMGTCHQREKNFPLAIRLSLMLQTIVSNRRRVDGSGCDSTSHVCDQCVSFTDLFLVLKMNYHDTHHKTVEYRVVPYITGRG